MEVNKQENGYECGMHVLEIAYQLIDTKFQSSGRLKTNSEFQKWSEILIDMKRSFPYF